MNKVKYYGIDIGDGESAVAVVSDKGAVLPQVLMLGNAKSMLSVVGELDGEPIIGDQALLHSGVSNIQARFKSRYLADPEASKTIACFARGLREKLRDNLTGAVEPHIALGCPAGWTADERQRYAAIVGAAGFPNLHTVAESRAAFLYVHYDSDIGLSTEELSQPALVVDIGSSTTDFAYIVDGKESEVGVFGNVYLGGGLLDRLILEDAVEHSPKRDQIQAVFDQYPSWHSLCELEARKAKEQYFSSEADWADKPFVRKILIYADVNSILNLTISLDCSTMHRLLETPIAALGGMTFPERLRESLAMAVENTAMHPPRQLILTGGASRMAFFQEACREAFSGAKVTLCEEPEYCIARGLSIASRIDYKLRYFRREIDDFFETNALRKDIVQHLSSLQLEICPILLKRIMEKCVKPALSAEFDTPEQLKAVIKNNVQQEFRQEGRTLETDDVIAEWIGSQLTKTQEQLDTICMRNDVERADLSLTKISLNVELSKMRFLSPLLPKLLSRIIIHFLYRPMPHLMKPAVEKALRKELVNPGGSFAKSLANSIETELRNQIQNNVEKVEIQIS